MSLSRSTTRTRISLASGAGDRHSPAGLIVAVALHAAIVIATLFTWEHRLDIAEESPPVVPVDLVTLAQKTNITPAEQPAPKIVPQPMPPQPAPPLVVQPPSVPQEQAEQAPSEPMVKPRPAPALPKPKPEHQTARDESAFNVDNLINHVLKSTAPSRKAVGPGTEMAADLRTIFFNEIHRCWNIGAIAGAPNPEQLVVTIELALNPDGTVARKPQLTAQSDAAAAANPYLRATADAALRTINQCAPYKLPPDRYSEWSDSQLKFSPQVFSDQ